MRRVPGVVALAAVLTAALVSAAFARPFGPTLLRAARAADAAPQVGANVQTQSWQVVAIDPRSHSVLLLTVGGSASQTAAQLSYWPTVPHTGYSDTYHDLGPPGTAPGFSARGLSLAYARGRWTLALDQGTVRLNLTFAAVRPGATATGWPVGQVTGPGTPAYLSTFDWAVPVASSIVTGSIAYDGHQFALTGWHGYIDQTWGRFDLGLGLMQHWDWAIAVDRQGTWIIDGFETGNGVSQWKHHDQMWTGVLIHAGAHTTTFCRSRIVRGGWRNSYGGLSGYVYPETLTASCNGTRVRFARLKLTNVGDFERGWIGYSVGTDTGGYGLLIEQNHVGG